MSSRSIGTRTGSLISPPSRLLILGFQIVDFRLPDGKG
jgi:hypothetical protein